MSLNDNNNQNVVQYEGFYLKTLLPHYYSHINLQTKLIGPVQKRNNMKHLFNSNFKNTDYTSGIDTFFAPFSLGSCQNIIEKPVEWT